MACSEMMKTILLSESAALKFEILFPYSLPEFKKKKRKRSVEGDSTINTKLHFDEFKSIHRTVCMAEDDFFDYLKMKKHTFDVLLTKVDEEISRNTFSFNKVSQVERLALTIRFLTFAEPFQSLALRCGVREQVVSEIVTDTCSTIWDALKDEYLPMPSIETWCSVAEGYYERWNFPNCIGCIDGKNIKIKCPIVDKNSTKTFSILLQAIIDADSKLIAVDIGTPEVVGGNFKSSSLYDLLEKSELNVPMDVELPGTNTVAPFVLLGNRSFPILNYLLRPYSDHKLDSKKRTFNDRLTRSRNAGTLNNILSKWFALHGSIKANLDNAMIMIKAVCVLHNFLVAHEKTIEPFTTEYYSGVRVKEQKINPMQSQVTPKRTRELFNDYFSNVGFLPWQNNIALPRNIV